MSEATDRFWLGWVGTVARRGRCLRTQTGAVLLSHGYLISVGWNQSADPDKDCLNGDCPRGQMSYDEVQEFSDYTTPGSPGFCIAEHAEMMALRKALVTEEKASFDVMDDIVVYCTREPCPDCRKVLNDHAIRVVTP